MSVSLFRNGTRERILLCYVHELREAGLPRETSERDHSWLWRSATQAAAFLIRPSAAHSSSPEPRSRPRPLLRSLPRQHMQHLSQPCFPTYVRLSAHDFTFSLFRLIFMFPIRCSKEILKTPRVPSRRPSHLCLDSFHGLRQL